MPETRERTSMSFDPSVCPTVSITSGTRCTLATITVTGSAGGGPPGGGAPGGGVSGALLQAASSAMQASDRIAVARSVASAVAPRDRAERAMSERGLDEERLLYTIMVVCELTGSAS